MADTRGIEVKETLFKTLSHVNIFVHTLAILIQPDARALQSLTLTQILARNVAEASIITDGVLGVRNSET
jgi:hypothetical protein